MNQFVYRPFKGFLMPPLPDIFAFVRTSPTDRAQRGVVANLSRLVAGEALTLHGPARVHDIWLILLDHPDRPIAILKVDELVSAIGGIPEGTEIREGDLHLPPGGSWALPVVALADILDGRMDVQDEAKTTLAACTYDLAEIQVEVGKWQNKTFGSTSENWGAILRHAQREGLELGVALFNYQEQKRAGNDLEAAQYMAQSEEEAADIMILVAGLAHHFGWDMSKAIAAKMAKNRRRKWGKPGRYGVIEHVEEGPGFK